MFSRRAFLKLLVALPFIYPLRAYAKPKSRPLLIGNPTQFKMGVTELRFFRVSIIKSFNETGKSTFQAISLLCTHQTCLVKNTNDGFLCPCHGSRFTEKGQVLNGPAVEPLPFFKLSYKGEKLYLHNSEVVSPDWTLVIK